MEKNIAHPTDARLYEQGPGQLVALADDAGVTLRQNYNRLAPRWPCRPGAMPMPAVQADAQGAEKAEGLHRPCPSGPAPPARRDPRGSTARARSGRAGSDRPLLHQGPKSRARSTPCTNPRSTASRKARRGCGTNSAPRSASPRPSTRGSSSGMRALPGNPYDGHTLPEALEQVEILTDQAARTGRRRPRLPRPQRVAHAGPDQRHPPRPDPDAETAAATAQRHRAEIGHMKTDGRLSRCPLKGTTGDAIFAVLCGCGHNIRKILAHIRGFGSSCWPQSLQ
jgi:transposase, IS5 family